MNTPLLLNLQELGLPANEAKVYLALLETGQTTAGELIKKVQLHRAIVYESLDRLIEKKLAYKLTKQGVFYFQPTEPDRILEEARAKERLAEVILPQLQSILGAVPSEMAVYEGLDAYRKYWIDLWTRLPEGSTDYVAGSIGAKWQEYMGPYLEEYLKIRLERRIKWKMIVFDRDEVEIGLLRKYPDLHEYRLVSRDVAKQGNFNILGEESILLQAATEPMLIEIKNTDLVGVFKNLFDILWEAGEPISG